MSDLPARAQLCEIGRRLWQRGLISAAEGNLSMRISPLRILATPAGVSKGHLKPSDLVLVDRKGVPVEGGTPSTELKLHLRIYDKRPDCQAIVHAHPAIATGFALAGEEIPDDLMPESATVLGSVATVPYATPGTEELPDANEPLLEDHKTFLLSHHGAVTLGKDLLDAYDRMETLERVARIYLTARLLGGAKPMPEDAFVKLAPIVLHGRLI